VTKSNPNTKPNHNNAVAVILSQQQMTCHRRYIAKRDFATETLVHNPTMPRVQAQWYPNSVSTLGTDDENLDMYDSIIEMCCALNRE